ncbi:MAG: SdrD B-like domain-containing protein [Chloroflexota bacterium]
MKRLVIFGLILVLLTACGKSEPPYTDNGHPGQIKAVVFFDDNKNGTMDNNEAGAPQRVATTREVTCTPAQPNFVPTDANGEVLFKDLKPGKYCVFIDNGYGMTTPIQLQVYVSSDLVTTVMFGVVKEQ